MSTAIIGNLQQMPALKNLQELPDERGFAGMYAGVSNGNLFCMGGANFPDKMPWEGGKKKWHNNIYMLQDGKEWITLSQSLSQATAYGISISYKEEIIIVGGCNESKHFDQVIGYTWNGKDLKYRNYPSLPISLAYMAGALLKNKIVVAGGSEAPGDKPVKKCFILDLDKPEQGWIEISAWPGSERIIPACAVTGNSFYLFSGETTVVNAAGDSVPLILQDAYRLTFEDASEKPEYIWQALAPMPKGASAASNPLPTLKSGMIILWGGVDAVSRLHKDPAKFPGIANEMLLYNPHEDTWSYAGQNSCFSARVTLPTVLWNDQWVFISGEVKPGIRTNQVTGFKNY